MGLEEGADKLALKLNLDNTLEMLLAHRVNRVHDQTPLFDNVHHVYIMVTTSPCTVILLLNRSHRMFRL